MFRATAVYFGLVFGAGFVLGPLRVLVLEPRVGPRAAELCEAPVMLLAIVLSGWWVGRRWCAGRGASARLGVGFMSAGLVLLADIGVGVGLRGMSVVQVFTGRDPVSGAVYYGLLALFVVAPWLADRLPASGAIKPSNSTDALPPARRDLPEGDS